MERLQRAGLIVVPITGRPAGWCDHIARMWPVRRVVGENGAFYFRYDHGARSDAPPLRRRRRDARAPAASGSQRSAGEILQAVPGAAIAADQRYRETDLAIDFCEDVPRLPRRGGRAHRRADAGARPHRESELDPRERLVRRPTTSSP